ncbi:MAG: NAD(P)/FAD-dependent oxidoreductase [Opitutales bacterium]
MKPITVVGGGLAGLSLGYALSAEGVPVTLHEAGALPRHRVCGEFLCGRGADALDRLGLGETLSGALTHRELSWFFGETSLLRRQLPQPALGLSRYQLDQRLAERFRKADGQLIEHSRFRESNADTGVVLCSGRRPARSDWLGLKVHCLDLATQTDLELHMGNNGYVGLSAVEDGRTNVCALFRRRPGLKAEDEPWLIAYIRACGLESLAKRVLAGGMDPESHAGVAGMEFGTVPGAAKEDRLRLGDAYGVIPPFTGNGMSIALESAETALPHLLRYAGGKESWTTTVSHIHETCAKRFGTRLRVARQLHPWITEPRRQQLLSYLCGTRLLPFQTLYRWTH